MNQSFETLGDGLYLKVSPAHRFGTDSFLLARFTAPKRRDRVCDLGTGCGILPFLFMKWNQPQTVCAVDIQEEAIALLKESIERSPRAGNIQPVLADWNHLPERVAEPFWDVVVCNPPYQALGTGKISRQESAKAARHEVFSTIDQVCAVASELLRFGGRFCLCQRANRLVETICAMKQAGMQPKRLQFCAKDASSSPWMFLLEGRKGGKPFMQVLPPVLVYDQAGAFTDQIKRIYGQEEIE